MKDKTVGYRLRQLRLENDMSFRDMAEAIGVTDTTVMRWEKDKRTPSFRIAIEICQKFHCTPNWLAGMEDTQHGKA